MCKKYRNIQVLFMHKICTLKMMQNSHYFPFYFWDIGYPIPSFIRTPPQKSNAPLWAFCFCVGVAVWTKRSQSMIVGCGASVDENEPFGEVWILRSERGPLRQCGANGNQTIPSSPPQKSNAPLWAFCFCVGVVVWTKGCARAQRMANTRMRN